MWRFEKTGDHIGPRSPEEVSVSRSRKLLSSAQKTVAVVFGDRRIETAQRVFPPGGAGPGIGNIQGRRFSAVVINLSVHSRQTGASSLRSRPI